jgi:hypothetical protein
MKTLSATTYMTQHPCRSGLLRLIDVLVADEKKIQSTRDPPAKIVSAVEDGD